MKRSIYIAAGLALFAAALCWLCLPRANAQAAPVTQPSTNEQQRYNQLVHDQEDRARRVESLLVRQEQLMDKQEAAFTRFQKILDTWEQQQKQYQKYLDSLPK